MATQTKGKCKYCGKEYTKTYMIKHLLTCKDRAASIEAEKGPRCGCFELVITGKYTKAYWLIIEVSEEDTLETLDQFLRDIWLECCGHLSSFEINGINYDRYPSNDTFWGPPAKSMKCKLKTVLRQGMVIDYEYDFGSSTDLTITVQSRRVAFSKTKKKITILSRNNPPQILCDQCHEKPATMICTECFYEGEGFLCDDCSKTHECGEDMQLPVCNSPRMGVCGYEGSHLYPDQFVPDKEV